jgi:hypothetical protein
VCSLEIRRLHYLNREDCCHSALRRIEREAREKEEGGRTENSHPRVEI